MRDNDQRQTVSVFLPQELYQALQQKASEAGITLEQFATTVLETYLRELGPDGP